MIKLVLVFVFLLCFSSCKKVESEESEYLPDGRKAVSGKIQEIPTNQKAAMDDCLAIGLSPVSKDIDKAFAYYRCRNNYKRYNKPTEDDLNPKLKEVLEADKSVCNKYGFDIKNDKINAIKYYRCLSMLMLTNGEYTDSQMKEIDSLSDLPNLKKNAKYEDVKQCGELSNTKFYQECMEKISQKNICNENLELKLSIDYYNSIIDCRNFVAIKYPLELSEKRTKNVKYADDDGDLKTGILKLEPIYSKEGLDAKRDEEYSSCIVKKRQEIEAERIDGVGVCKTFDASNQ